LLASSQPEKEGTTQLASKLPARKNTHLAVLPLYLGYLHLSSVFQLACHLSQHLDHSLSLWDDLQDVLPVCRDLSGWQMKTCDQKPV
jgi:hypothetical protein